MRLKIRCDGESWKVFGFWVKVRPCLVPQKFYKIFKIPRHIESLGVCMEY